MQYQLPIAALRFQYERAVQFGENSDVSPIDAAQYRTTIRSFLFRLVYDRPGITRVALIAFKFPAFYGHGIAALTGRSQPIPHRSSLFPDRGGSIVTMLASERGHLRRYRSEQSHLRCKTFVFTFFTLKSF